MKLYFEDKTKKYKKSDFEKRAQAIFKKLRINDKIELGLKLTDNQEIRKLNRKFRHLDMPTDVLSFPIDLPAKNRVEPRMIGDIVISLDFVKNKKEAMELFDHGLLHLLGFDHEKKQKEWQSVLLKIDNCKL